MSTEPPEPPTKTTCVPRQLPWFSKRSLYPGIEQIETPFEQKDPQLGDLVMATAGDITHPAVTNNSVDASFLLLGVVSENTYARWVTEEGQEV